MRKILQIVEIDIDTCGRTFGVAPCGAVLSASNPNKCYNTFQTCSFKSAFQRQSMTLKFCEASYPIKGGEYIPVLKSVGGYEQEVNIAGYNPNLGGIGRRASVKVVLHDFPTRDTETDKYWSERISGAAQVGAGYDPIDRGSFWTKFKARNPNYAGRVLRVIQAHYNDAGGVVYDTIRTYVMDEIAGPDSSGESVTITAKDILSLADNDKAMCPTPSPGRLLADITAEQTTVTLTPAGIGNAQYPASGWATIGSEIVQFSRVNNVLTLVRGRSGTQAAQHSANDTVQVAFRVERIRADIVIRNLLVNFGNVPASYINFAEWQSEFDRWGSKMLLSATICKPNSVTKLLSEINQLGITLWWDEVAQRIRIKLNHPPDEPVSEWSDRNNIMSIKQEDNDDERVTQIDVWTVQIDPTKELATDNFLRGYLTVSADSQSPNMFGLPRTKTIQTRWLNHGDDSAVKIIAGRLLNRYKRAPVTYTVTVDAKDDPSLTDVITLNTYLATDITGLPTPKLMQVYYRADEKSGSTVKAKLQLFQFDARYGQIAPNNYPVYNQATPTQKIHGSFFVGTSLTFADGSPPYQLV